MSGCLLTKLLRARCLICHYCGEAWADTRDHIVPVVRGGCNAYWNMVPACEACNKAKGSDVPTCPCGQCRGAVRRDERLQCRKTAAAALLADALMVRTA